MNRKLKYYSKLHIASCLFMIITLLWLTVSTPYVNAAQNAKIETEKKSQTEDNSNPFANTTEEKNESGVNSLSEYLHDHDTEDPLPVIIPKYYKCHPSDLYFAFHPELISPPPEA